MKYIGPNGTPYIQKNNANVTVMWPSRGNKHRLNNPVVYRRLLVPMSNILMVARYSFDVTLARGLNMTRGRIRIQPTIDGHKHRLTFLSHEAIRTRGGCCAGWEIRRWRIRRVRQRGPRQPHSPPWRGSATSHPYPPSPNRDPAGNTLARRGINGQLMDGYTPKTA